MAIKRVPNYHHLLDKPVASNIKTRDAKSCDPVHIFHTSGTSSGLPKAIVQTHWAAVGALPCLPDMNPVATFSTTPLYHGGVADCFRSWTSGSMVWFFPEGLKPITSANIIEAVMCARKMSTIQVKYFTGVPYVLQMLGENETGVQLLQSSKYILPLRCSIYCR